MYNSEDDMQMVDTHHTPEASTRGVDSFSDPEDFEIHAAELAMCDSSPWVKVDGRVTDHV